jgi:hypothetical protein
MTATIDEYDAIDAMRWSRLKLMAKSPLAFHAYQPGGDSPAMRLGRAIHTAVLEPERFKERHPVFQGAQRRGKVWDEFAAEHAGADVLSLDEYHRASMAAESVRSHPVARRFFEQRGHSEQVITWSEPTTHVMCKAKIDRVGEQLIELIELKSVGSMDFEPFRFSAHFARLLYHGQVAFYADGLVEGIGLRVPPVVIAVESDEPYDVAVYEIPGETIAAGRTLYQRLLRRYVECTRAGKWPGVCEQEIRLDLPRWALEET